GTFCRRRRSHLGGFAFPWHSSTFASSLPSWHILGGEGERRQWKMTVVGMLKPFVFFWASLRAFDELALILRLGRLAESLIPFPGRKNRNNPYEMCGMCDDVMDEIMLGYESFSVIPCRAACLGLGKCVRMCEKLQEEADDTNVFPCIAAGFCDPAGATDVLDLADPDHCRAGAFFSCHPKKYCRRRRRGMRVRCELKPGIGRWLGMQRAARDHAGALAHGLLFRTQCGERGAGKYCIARPRGTGLAAEVIGTFVPLAIGSVKSIAAIETPGGGDDRQWLVFWIVLALLGFVENFFARVLLSNCPWYYHAKLLVLCLLIWSNGFAKIYRKLRRWAGCHSRMDEETAKRQLQVMKSAGKSVFPKSTNTRFSFGIKREWNGKNWEYARGRPTSSRELYDLSKYILSTDGAKRLLESEEISRQNKMLLIERAAHVVSFQPRFLHIHLKGTKDGPQGELPPMDTNGLADPYVTCRLVPENGSPYPEKGVSSKILYKTISPQWDEELEIQLRGGSLDADGYFLCGDDVESTQLKLTVYDADVGRWHIAYYLFRAFAVILIVGGVTARIKGLSDDMTPDQRHAASAAVIFVVAGNIVSFVMAVLCGSDDECVGWSSVPIGMLTDQREHKLLLTLKDPRENPDSQAKGTIFKTTTNSKGGLGILRVNVFLSEN
ncbi:hypothetical protein ACHAWF_002661, partial [Thalassiosira exigua]